MAQDLPKVPKAATNANYPAGANPWSGLPTKVALSSDYELNGWTPDQPIAAQHENKWKNDTYLALLDAQERAAVKVNDGGTIASATGHAVFLGFRKVLSVPESGPTLYQRSVDFRHQGSSAGGTVANAVKRCSLEKGSASENVGLHFVQAAVGGTNAVYASTGGTYALPNGGGTATYYDACTDVTTGNALFGAMNGTPGFARLTAAAGPMAFAAPTGYDTASQYVQLNGSIASKPGETRVFTFLGTFATTNGGTSSLSASVPAWFGGVAPAPTLTAGVQTGGSVLMRPTWDTTNGRWLVATNSFSPGVANLWYSYDGVNWNFLVTLSNFAADHIVYHRGWLWMLGRPTNESNNANEIYYSKDGGATWIRSGFSLGFDSSADWLDHRHKKSIEIAGPNLIFQSTISGSLKYLVLTVGGGY